MNYLEKRAVEILNNEESITKLLLLTCQVYQEIFDKLWAKKDATIDFMQLSTIQGMYQRELVNLMSKLNVKDISSINDIIKSLSIESEMK